MATERQIEANRRNAQKSTGPKSTAGLKRSSRNALRHGLTKPLCGTRFEDQIEIMARQIAGDQASPTKLALARVAAEAEFELQRIRQLEVAMHEHVMQYGSLDPPRLFRSAHEELRWMTTNVEWLAGRSPLKRPWPDLVDPSASMPTEELDKSAEAIRRLLPELTRLLRYERRAAGRRNKAFRQISKL
jgi:hypothetical protein